MSKIKKISNLLDKKVIKKLKPGEEILFSGKFYTARDQAHQKIKEIIKQEKKLPFNPEGKVVYYCGPTDTPLGKSIGSCGPTTSSRMDLFIEPLLKRGLLAMVGKGRRSPAAKALIKKYGAVYFLAPSGCGAMLSQFVLSKKLICFPELGPEAIYQLKVENFPLIVGVDSAGRSIYK
ncbi:MAG: FumA C-terminus/TtdB family hydratase beta subunit [Candidatus Omnitrophica bacterium]|nr:FumA C-terminus/TtdB family hydratase beta subunit [Candidatus Omnitrophota bacterium]MCF7877472.1 FumA C-terminus/TtdB family hydratase beta subunit [Candidatus Omnitrophota bacterium]MCF7878385.1 FumA C-terminus/TtdB family hydratase beta subunit [Candidatus Omnitrophota bacterium]MCF7892843.1 FumA C-terminus/TtdB family hydratase beta subunit [Candidatus Omnitrophota bacterium]